MIALGVSATVLVAMVIDVELTSCVLFMTDVVVFVLVMVVATEKVVYIIVNEVATDVVNTVIISVKK